MEEGEGEAVLLERSAAGEISSVSGTATVVLAEMKCY